MTQPENLARYPNSWYAATATPVPATMPLFGDASAEVCIIGGGYTGLSAALHLARQGVDVILLDQARLGWGASGRNGGQVHVAMRQDQIWFEKHCGNDAAQRFWAMALAARDHLDWACLTYDIDAGFRPGLLHLDHKPQYVAHSQAHAAHMRDRYGYALETIDREQARTLVASDGYHGGTFDRRGGHLHALNWALGLADAARREGARLHDRTAVTAIDEKQGRMIVRTTTGAISAERVVLACNGYLQGISHKVEARVMPINNYIATTAPLGADRAAALIRDRLAVSDSRFVVYYFRMTPDHRLLFGGGETYSRAFPRDIAAFVRPHIRKIFPQLADIGIDYAWGGTLAVTFNRLPLVRWVHPKILNLSGFSGLGVIQAPYFGKLAADALVGGSADLDLLMSLPSRSFPGGRMMRWPTLAAAMSFFALRDRL